MAWNKGLTKKDSRVKKYADKLVGREITPEWRKKISLAHKGVRLSESHRRNISISLTGRQRTKEERKKISEGLQGRKFSIQTRTRMRLAKIGKKQTMQHKMQIINSWTDEKRKQASIRRSKQKLPLKDTKLEKLVQQILIDSKIHFKKHQPVDLGFMIHQADLFINPDKIIEVFGTYHHADPRKYKPDYILKVKGHSTAEKIWKQDELIINSLIKKSFKVLIVWQTDLYHDYERTKDLILNFIKNKEGS